jgi:hypothetical protein
MQNSKSGLTAPLIQNLLNTKFLRRFFIRNAKFFIPFIFFHLSSVAALNGQICDPEADFTTTVNGCTVNFQSSYSGTAVHSWSFFDNNSVTGLPSVSNLVNPQHTFRVTSSLLKRVVHTVTITMANGQTVIKTCEKSVSTNCNSNSECNGFFYFHYRVNGCTLTILDDPSGELEATWNFGDNTPPITTNTPPPPTHTYAQSGTYFVTVLVDGQSCGLWITVFCEPQICCTASFAANIYRDCGVLRLSLDADCNTGKHEYTVTPIGSGTCFNLVNFQPTAENQTIQITNINTGLITGFQITHNYICADGQAITQTKIVTMPTPAAIFVGRENQTTNLTNYGCVLPGDTYNNTRIVYVSGIVQINKKFTFVGADIQFHPGLSGFDIFNFSTPIQLTQNSRARGVADCNCMWRGMILKSTGSISVNTGSSIEDAVQGILVDDKVPSVITLKLDGAKFYRNFVGIQGLMYLKFSTLQNTLFDGEGPLKNICTLDHTIKAPLVNNIVTKVPFNTQQGFAGIYIKNSISPLTLPFLTQKNLFNNLAYGILAFDTNIDIDRNSRFTNITGTVHGTHRNAAIALIDGVDKGPNTFKFRGTNIPDSPSSLPDFDLCWYGIIVKCDQSGSPTKVGITNALMDHMRTGIFLDSRSKEGSFLGTSTTSGFTGIRNNRITATLTSPSLFTNAGISTFDYNSKINNIQIANNVVTMRYGQGASTAGSAGIAAIGVDPITDPGANLNEKVDIFDNRILIEAEGEIGIATFYYPRVSIRNHRDNDNGIFHNNPSSTFPGIKIEGGTGLIVSCNDVTALSSSDEYPLLYNFRSTNSNFLNNRLTGNGIGITVKGICTGDNIRCNEMQNNRVGLTYIDGALTGPQGSPASQGSPGLSFGNRWFGNFTTGAVVGNGVNPQNSPFYVRQLIGEVPPSFQGPQSNSWFSFTLPNAPINCLASCPLPSVIQAPVLTKLDSLIATNQVDFGSPNLFAEKSWQCQFDLSRTLTDYPNLAQNNTLMQGFLNSTNVSNISALLQVQRNMRNAFAFSNTVLTTIQNNNQAKAQIGLQIQTTDSLIGIATDSAQLSVLYQQRIAQDSLLNLLVQANEALTTQHDAQSLASVPSLLAQLNAITPTIVCETNLKRVMEIYLQTLAFGVEPTTTMVSDVHGIATQCVDKGGIGVLAARSMYYAFTAIWLNEDNCVGDRNAKQENSNAGISIFPNPTTGTFAVQFSDAYLNTKMTLTIVNAIGSTVQYLESEGISTKIIDLSTQPNGLYFAIIRNEKGVLTSLPGLLQH